MSRLIASILLSILMFPLAILLFFLTWFALTVAGGYRAEKSGLLAAGCLACSFVGVYWIALWRKTVRWTPARTTATAVAAVAAGVVGLMIGFLMMQAISTHDLIFPVFIATVIAPLLWVFATILIWRENPAERAGRLAGADANGVACPTCGYNLTGLRGTRCPECGTEFTLDQLFAQQAEKSQGELEQA
jgi:hypothetical protein